MQAYAEFGGCEYKVEMNIFIYAQAEVIPPPFLSRMVSRGTNGERPAGGVGEEGATMPRTKRSNPKTKHQSIKLRTPVLAGGAREELTPAERKLWSRIRNDQLGVTFRRQHAVDNYIPDFSSPKVKLIIELDGSQHLEQEEYDVEQTKYFEAQGYKVIRFWNDDVMKDIESVIRAIIFAMASEPHP